MIQTRRIEKLLQPATKQKALLAARTFQQRVFSSTGSIDCYRLASEALRGRFSRNSQPEIDVLVAFVISETLRATEEDIKEIEGELRKMNRAEQELRNAFSSVAARAGMTRGKSQNIKTRAPLARVQGQHASRRMTVRTVKTRNLGISYPDLVADPLNVYNLATGKGKVTIGGLKSLLDDMKGKLDGLNEMSEMTSLRLQMTMDRRSKFISTLSQMMKKISTTQDILIQNIK